MKRLYHVCFTSKNEVCCRSVEDYRTMISRIGQSAVVNDAHVWAYAVMSNHVHIVVQSNGSDNVGSFVKTIRSSYNQSFNRKYLRNGKLGEEGFFRTLLQGRQHIIDALTYVMQNPWHHRIVENPFDYPFSSMCLYFKNGGYGLSPNIKYDKEPLKCKRLVSKYISLPKSLTYDRSGMIEPISFVETSFVESMFGSYNAFQYLTHRKNYSEWKNEQILEASEEPIVNLLSIEPFLNREDIKMIESNGNKWMKERTLTDIEICKLVDNHYVPKFKKNSYVELGIKERDYIMKDLLVRYPYNVSESQVRRCIFTI